MQYIIIRIYTNKIYIHADQCNNLSHNYNALTSSVLFLLIDKDL